MILRGCVRLSNVPLAVEAGVRTVLPNVTALRLILVVERSDRKFN